MLHIFLHFLVPAILVALFFRQRWLRSYIIVMATMLVDLDHLVADPIYDPNRCSIGFHPLHQVILFPAYLILAVLPKTRLVGLGLLIHMALDSIDCQVTNGMWSN